MPSTRTLITWLLLSIVMGQAIPIQTVSTDGARNAMLDPGKMVVDMQVDGRGLTETLIPTIFGRSPMQNDEKTNHESDDSVHPDDSISNQGQPSPTSPTGHEWLYPKYQANAPVHEETITQQQVQPGLKAAFVVLENAQKERTQASKDMSNLNDVVAQNQKHDDLQNRYNALTRIIESNVGNVLAWVELLVTKAVPENNDLSKLLNEINQNVYNKPGWKATDKRQFENYKKKAFKRV
ncbi:hypothetical protein H0H93_006804 [Arthromyces matolae]|nr:hypothetical protein H0H93_006804 [Arthromyces matolae]